MALRGIFIRVALSAQELVILGGEGLVHQRALALKALEAVLMPMAVLVGQILQEHQLDSSNHCFTTPCTLGVVFSYPGVAANGFLALLTCVGIQAFVTFHTVGVVLSKNVLLPKQGLLAIVAVVALRHFGPQSLIWWKSKEK